jgi:hypothetical protein
MALEKGKTTKFSLFPFFVFVESVSGMDQDPDKHPESATLTLRKLVLRIWIRIVSGPRGTNITNKIR